MPHPDERQPSWWLDPPEDYDPEAEADARRMAEDAAIDRYLDSLDD